MNSHQEIKKASTSQLVTLYNTLTGKTIKKFRDRKTAEEQTWKVLRETFPVEPKKVKPKPESKRDSYESRIIRVLIESNPKRPGTRAFDKFDLLMKMNGRTIREYKGQEGQHPDLDNKEKGWASTEIRWALKQEWIKIVAQESKKDVA